MPGGCANPTRENIKEKMDNINFFTEERLKGKVICIKEKDRKDYVSILSLLNIINCFQDEGCELRHPHATFRSRGEL